jgi:hypothetical protein
MLFILFILALEPLHKLLALAEANFLLTPIQNRAAKIRISLYADDVAVFVNPVNEEIDVIKEIFESFGRACGLHINFEKSAAYPIRCEGLDLCELLQNTHCPLK